MIRFVVAIVLMVAFSAAAVVGFAQQDVPVDDVKTLAGAWAGNVPIPSGRLLYVVMHIKEDGSYVASAQGPGNKTVIGTLRLSGGRIRYESSFPGNGSVTLMVVQGKRVLRFMPDAAGGRPSDYEEQE